MWTSTRLTLLAAIAALPLAACQTTEKAVTTAQSAVQAQATPTLSTTDATFLNTAAAGDLAEVQFGQLASTRGTRASTRRFGSQMEADHTTVNQELMTLADSKQFTPPGSMDTMHEQMFSQLQATKGRAFDKPYLDGQVQDHQAMVQAFQTEAQGGTDPDVKAFAAHNLPMLQRHLRTARQLDPAH
jgi:putative membrane protein